MKGLLTKDFLTIKKKYGLPRVIMDIAIIIALMFILEKSGTIYISFLLIPIEIMSMIISLTTCDEQWKWGKYAVSLPVSKKQIVCSRYTPIFAYTDNEALQRILKNLIDNAIRHGGDGKYISLRLITSNGKNIIEIEDRGDGISPQQQKQIFERNYTTARKTSGSGLGLSISKCLAEQIGADLEVYSVQNEQTIFSIILKKLENR